MIIGNLQEAKNFSESERQVAQFEATSTLEEIVEKIAEISIDSISETKKMFRYPRMKNIIRYLSESEIVDVYGIGNSKWIAYDFKAKMAQIGRKVDIENEQVQQYYQAANANSKTHS